MWFSSRKRKTSRLVSTNEITRDVYLTLSIVVEIFRIVQFVSTCTCQHCRVNCLKSRLFFNFCSRVTLLRIGYFYLYLERLLQVRVERKLFQNSRIVIFRTRARTFIVDTIFILNRITLFRIRAQNDGGERCTRYSLRLHTFTSLLTYRAIKLSIYRIKFLVSL